MRIRYYGHIGKATGYGRAGEHLCLCLTAAGCELDIQPFLTVVGDHYINPVELDDHRLQAALNQGGESDAVIVHDLPVDAVQIGQSMANSDFADGPQTPLIVYTTWEAETVPESVIEPLVRTFDQIWVPSESNAKAFREAAKRYDLDDTCIRVVPHAYDADQPPIARSFDTGPYRFFWYGAWTTRKNPVGVIHAFCHAFDKNDNVQLLMHSANLTVDDAALSVATMGDLALSPVIKFSNGVKPLSDIMGDCFVTAARGEAWNLPAFEASVLAGTQVIAPHTQGSDDYLMSSSARFVGSMRAPARVDADISAMAGGRVTANVKGAQGLNVKAVWREPNLVQIALAMRDVYEKNERAISFGYNTAERWGYPAVGVIAKNLLEHLINDN